MTAEIVGGATLLILTVSAQLNDQGEITLNDRRQSAWRTDCQPIIGLRLWRGSEATQFIQ